MKDLNNILVDVSTPENAKLAYDTIKKFGYSFENLSIERRLEKGIVEQDCNLITYHEKMKGWHYLRLDKRHQKNLSIVQPAELKMKIIAAHENRVIKTPCKLLNYNFTKKITYEEQYRYSDIMVDIETLDTKSSSIILSIGAVAFDLESNNKNTVEFYSTLDIADQVQQGRTSSISTGAWWNEQSEEAQNEAFSGEAKLFNTIIDFQEYIYKYCHPFFRIWAKSPAFDLVILKDAIGDDIIPWNHRNERCVRTYCDDMITGSSICIKSEPTHHPVKDCLDQIEQVCAVYSLLNKNVQL